MPYLLDLRSEFAAIYSHLASNVQGFDPAGSNVLGTTGKVKMIEVGFEYAQQGWVVVVFDTRDDAEPDGEWTSLINDENMFPCPHWMEAGEDDQLLSIIQLDGKKTNLPKDKDLAEYLGETIKAVLFKAREDGLFTNLPKVHGCEMGIEHFDGGYGWPQYEARGEENLI